MIPVALALLVLLSACHLYQGRRNRREDRAHGRLVLEELLKIQVAAAVLTEATDNLSTRLDTLYLERQRLDIDRKRLANLAIVATERGEWSGPDPAEGSG